LIFSAGMAAIDCVWRGGRKLVSEGRHHGRAPIAARYRQVIEKLLA
jgi:formimidoylglutamate deiminase